MNTVKCVFNETWMNWEFLKGITFASKTKRRTTKE